MQKTTYGGRLVRVAQIVSIVTALPATGVYAQTNGSPRRAQLPDWTQAVSVAEMFQATNTAILTRPATSRGQLRPSSLYENETQRTCYG
jgi:hypothetical protein